MVRSTLRPTIKGADAVAALAFQGWVARVVDGRSPITTEHLEAARRNRIELLDHVPRAIDVDLFNNKRLAAFRNALSTQRGATGGFTVPEADFVTPWEQALLAQPIRELATVIRLDAGAVLREPVCDDSNNEGFILAESTALSTQDVVWRQLVHQPYKYHSGRVLVPAELEADATQFASQLAALLGDRVARRQNKSFTTGDGLDEPRGIVPAVVDTSGATYTAASSSSISGDDIWNLVGTLGPAYLDPAKAVFMMHPAVLVALLKLKAGSGEYLIFDRTSFRLNGFRIALNSHMASSITSGAVSVLLGDFSKFHIVDFGPVRVSRDSESHAESDQAAWGALQRSSAALVDAGTHPIVGLVH